MLRDESKETRNRRIADYVEKGQHQGIVSWALYEQCQQIRRSKGNNSQRQQRVAHIYPATGIAKCWPCSQAAGKGVALRGISSHGGRRYYRCAQRLDLHKQGEQIQPLAIPDLPAQVVRQVSACSSNASAVSCTCGTIPAEAIETQLDVIVQRLSIQAEWRERILAYFLSDEGMLEFDRQRYNLVQSIKQSTFLLKSRIISQAEFNEDYARFTQRLSRLSPSAHPAASPVLALLDDWRELYQRLSPEQRKGLTRILLADAFFDGPQLIKVVANAPFDRLLGLPSDGMMA